MYRAKVPRIIQNAANVPPTSEIKSSIVLAISLCSTLVFDKKKDVDDSILFYSCLEFKPSVDVLWMY